MIGSLNSIPELCIWRQVENRFLILFIPSMKCQLHCSYCGWFQNLKEFGGDKLEVGRDLKWFEWLVAFNPYRPYTLEITGGEPLLYSDFSDLVAHLPWLCNWSVTSNTLLDVSNITNRNLNGWTASFHFKEKKRFFDNCKILTRSGMKPSISMVVQPDRVDEVEEYVKEFTEQNQWVNLLRELNPKVDWRGSKEWNRLELIRDKYPHVNLVDDDSIPKVYQFPIFDICTAGMNYFAVIGDGQVFRCYSDLVRGESMGNIFNFRPFTEPQKCGKPCLGCATDYRQKKWNEKMILEVGHDRQQQIITQM